MHFWVGETETRVTLEIRRMDNELLECAARTVHADSTWAEVATELYEDGIKEYENRPREEADGNDR